MHWLFSHRRLRKLGVIGLNARNSGAIMGHNPRAAFPLVDDKIQMAELCERVGIPTPRTLAVFTNHGDLKHLDETLDAVRSLVIKPACGAGGRGVMVLFASDGGEFKNANRRVISRREIRRHLSDILSGLYSLKSKPDRALFQERVDVHPALKDLSCDGTPDIRVLVYQGVPAMAMLRLPTKTSEGKANLHQGGVGVGLEIEKGTTTLATWRGKRIERHPDSDAPLADVAIPDWDEVLNLSVRAARMTGLGYLGADAVIDPQKGPLLLEANARPGLAIQIANGKGLGLRLKAIDERRQKSLG